MTQSLYLRPIALAESPQSEEGAAIRLAGGLTYASRFAVIVREGGRIVSRERYGARELEAARRALAELTERDRQALLLKEEGLGYEEIASVLGIEKSSVGTTLSRARRRLAEAYEALTNPKQGGADAAS